MRPPLFSNRSRRLALALQWVVLLALVGFSFWTMHREPPTKEVKQKPQQEIRPSERRAQIIYAETEEEHPESILFDPNTADSTTLLRLGLSPWQVRSIYRFRAKHGRFHSPEDFMRTPHLTVEQWEHLAPLIRIADKYRLLSQTERIPERRSQQASNDTVTHHPLASYPQKEASEITPRDTTLYPTKYTEGTVVDLNTADTTMLKHIPNIGSYRARKIVEYGKKLGGYVQVEQIMESCQMPDDVMEWFRVESPNVKQININSASISQMMRHPYISFYLAKSIHEWRQKHGRIKDISTLFSLYGFREEQWPLLQHYVTLGDN